MSYVIIEKCLGERYAVCATVCPVECIHPGDYKGQEFMIIDPEVCINCGLCLPECPVGAIVASEDEHALVTTNPQELKEMQQKAADIQKQF